jgi:hypothetical protein
MFDAQDSMLHREGSAAVRDHSDLCRIHITLPQKRRRTADITGLRHELKSE